jgi:hypothetical protein
MGVRLKMINLGDEVLIRTDRWLCDGARGIVIKVCTHGNVLVQLIKEPYQYWLKEYELEVIN